MNILLSYIFLLIALTGFQRQEYIITKDKDFEHLFRIYKRSNVELTNVDLVNIDELCNDEMNRNLKFKENFAQYFLDREIATMTEYRVSMKMVVNSSGKIQQSEFTTNKNPSSIISLISKIDSIYSERGRLSTTACLVPEGKFAQINFMLRVRPE